MVGKRRKEGRKKKGGRHTEISKRRDGVGREAQG
jgi:hypothetical protein